jgi:chaperonin cofactor prefoldin
VRPDLLKQMDDTSILRLLTTLGELDPDRLAMIADLYKLVGDLLIDQNKNQEAVLDFQLSLTFYLEISLSGKNQRQKLDEKINQIYSMLSGLKSTSKSSTCLSIIMRMRGTM